jgi:tight adherence protein B
VLVVMSSRPEAAAAYDSPTGMMLVGGGAVATLAGYRSMLRAARLPEQPRWRP